MILQLSDFAGQYRLPAGLSTAEITAAVEQVEEQLLRELFEPDTVALILADPTQAPAQTLYTGAGGLGVRWAYLALPWALQSLRFGLIGQGIPDVGTHATPVRSTLPEGRLETFRLHLQRVRDRHWSGDGTVTATTATTLTIDLPPVSLQWLRAGMEIQIGGETVQVQSVSTLNVVVSLPSFVVAVGDVLRFLIPLKLRKRSDRWGVWTK